jgi:hypothetical protein
MSRTVDCPGCGQSIVVTGPVHLPLIIRERATDDGRPAVRVTVGTDEVHRCALSENGEWVVP